MRTSRRAVYVAALVFGMTVAARNVPPSDTWSIARAPAEIRYYVSRADLISHFPRRDRLRSRRRVLSAGAEAIAWVT
jgi:hypothetical protein